MNHSHKAEQVRKGFGVWYRNKGRCARCGAWLRDFSLDVCPGCNAIDGWNDYEIVDEDGRVTTASKLAKRYMRYRPKYNDNH